MDAEDVAAYRAMTPPEKLTRVLKFTERIRQFKIGSVRVRHPGWSEKKVTDEVRRCVRSGMNPAELYDCGHPSEAATPSDSSWSRDRFGELWQYYH